MDRELVVAGRVRIPDLIILGKDLAAVLLASGRSTITVDMPTPLLVVEVVSPGKINQDREYRFKRTEYATRGILHWVSFLKMRSVETVVVYNIPSQRF